MPKDREVELKYVVPSAQMLAIIATDAQKLSIRDLRVELFKGIFSRFDEYYDTADLLLLRTQRCLRVGYKSATRARIAFKEKTSDPIERVEIENTVHPSKVYPALEGAYASKAMDALHSSVGHIRVYPTVRVYKMFYAVRINKCAVVFGHTVYAGSRGAMERIDLEVEAVNGVSKRTVIGIGNLLTMRYQLTMDMRSKYQVGMEAVGELPK